MVKVAVIGAGLMGKNHARVYSELVEVQLVAVDYVNLQTRETVSN
jgi:predicted dehydrogenase